MSQEIKVLIVDDHPLLRKGLRDLLEKDHEIEVIGEAENGAQALEASNRLKPDILVLDIDMPVLDGIEVARILKKSRSSPRVIFLTIHKDRSLLRSIRALGARGYVLKDSALTDIVDCIKAVIQGKTFVSKEMESHIQDKSISDERISGLVILEKLTPTEVRVLGMIANSRTNNEIADEFSVSIRTVENHRYNICQKLDLKGSHALFKFAVSNKTAILNAIRLGEST